MGQSRVAVEGIVAAAELGWHTRRVSEALEGGHDGPSRPEGVEMSG